jgi:replicative DNA helicase
MQHSLYSGLYVLGALSSLGKTTFLHQMADNLAMRGEHVLYFSLEQTEFELTSKSISRTLYSWRSQTGDPSVPLYTAIELRRGAGLNDPKVDDAIDIYTSNIGGRLTIIPTLFSIDVEGIIWTISDYIDKYDVKPIVIIDYLQIITPTLINGRVPDEKAAIDHIVHTLKCYQAKEKLVIMLISSLNRQNYLAPLDFSSFKQSGQIEYSADTIFGLEPSCLHTNEIFSKENHLKEKREAINAAKAASPRQISFVCLKNRFGISNYMVNFNYYPAYDIFLSPRTDPNAISTNNNVLDVNKGADVADVIADAANTDMTTDDNPEE